MLITADKFDKALAYLSEIDTLAIDTETYKTASWQSRILLGVSTYGKLQSGQAANFYFPFRHGNTNNLPVAYLSKLATGLKGPNQLLFHNAKFDLNILRRDKIVLEQPFYDTMIMSHLLQVNGTHALKELAKLYGIDKNADHEKKLMAVAQKQYKRWDQIPASVMEPYACKDTKLTYNLFHVLKKLLEKSDLWKLWEEEELYCRALATLEYSGMQFDIPAANKLDDESYARMQEIKDTLKFDPAKSIDLARVLFEELGFEPTYASKKKKYTPTKSFPNGQPDMDEAALSKYKHPIVDLVIEYRGLQKARSTWYVGLPEFCDDNCRIHTHFNQIGTVTTRLTSSQPNLQQLPRNLEETPVRKLFCAEPDHYLYEFDYSQIEYRLAAVYAKEERILEAYSTGADFHELTSNMLGITRQDGKMTNFLLLYLGGPERLASELGLTFNAAKDFKNRYHRLYSKLYSKAHEVNYKAEKQGYINLWTGHRTEFQVFYEAKKAWNRLIQGGAHQIMKYGIINVYNSKGPSKMVSTVHDSLLVQIPKRHLADEIERIKFCLEWASRDERFRIPFPVDVKLLAKDCE